MVSHLTASSRVAGGRRKIPLYMYVACRPSWVRSRSNPFLFRPFPFPCTGLIPRPRGPYDFTLLNGCMDLFAWCVRLSRLLVGFRTHFKSLHFHSFIHWFISFIFHWWMASLAAWHLLNRSYIAPSRVHVHPTGYIWVTHVVDRCSAYLQILGRCGIL